MLTRRSIIVATITIFLAARDGTRPDRAHHPNPALIRLLCNGSYGKLYNR